MNLEIVTVGTELLLGYTVDTNSAFAARTLGGIGVRVVRRTAVPDRAEEIRAGVSEALGRTGVVLVTGGLGPTRDDITKHTVAELFGAPLDFDETIWAALVERFRSLGRNPSPMNRSQAEVPRGAQVLPNRWGTAPGLWLEGPPGLVIMLPGVPLEMRNLLTHEVVPRLVERAGGSGGVIVSRLVRTSGIPESQLAERIGDVEAELAPLTLAYLPGVEGVDLRVTAWQLPAAEADARLDAAVALLRERAGEYVYAVGEDDLAAVVLEAARARRIRIAVAESCTGGLVGGRLTEIAGSSDVFLGGIVSYANEAKRDLLGVPAAVLEQHGAVSEPVARAMAEGALARFGAGAAVAVTGIAGPGGGTEEKPVGTVWLAVAVDGMVETRRTRFHGGRAEIRARAAQAALFLLLRTIRARIPEPTESPPEQSPR